jgi:transcriptional regulator with XRE-family HTH domain
MLDAIRSEMDSQDYTISQLAERAEMDRAQLSSYLSGAKSPGLQQLQRIAKGLGCRWVLTEE